MKKIYLAIFACCVSFFFIQNVKGANLYECTYKDDKYTVTLNIKANRDLDPTVIVKKKSMSDRTFYGNVKNWNTTTESVKSYIGSLGCPKYIALEEKEEVDINSRKESYSYNAWFNWNNDKSKGHCDGKKDCYNIPRDGNPGPKVKFCYYDAKGKRTYYNKNSVLMAFQKGNGVEVITTTPRDTVAGGSYDFEGNKSAFYPSSQFQCLDAVYVCKRDIKNTFDRYYVLTSEEDIGYKPELCKERVDDIAQDAHETNAKKKGMSIDDWLSDTEGPTAEECKQNPETPGCVKNSCEVIRTDGELFKILKEVIGYVQIGSIFVVLVLSILDLGGAIASSDDDAFRKARGKVAKRIIALILIFLVPLLINFTINLVNLGACKEEDYDFIGNLFH